jgi:hypothetical protein
MCKGEYKYEVLEPIDLEWPDGMEFDKWTDGAGNFYDPGNCIELDSDLDLYAVGKNKTTECTHPPRIDIYSK